MDLREFERLNDIIASIADWTWEVDADGVYTYCGPQVETILGYQPDEIIGRTPFEFMAPGEAERIGTVFASLAANRAPIRDLENWNLARDGRRVCLRTNGRPYFGPAGDFRGYRGADTDVTHLKLAEREKASRLDLLRSLIDAIPNPIFYKDSQGRYLGCNDAFAEALGHDRDEIVGRTAADFSSPDRARIYQGKDEALLRAGGQQNYETDVRFADGEDHRVVFAKAAFPDPSGEGHGIVGVMNDVTELKRLQDELVTARQAADAANAAKSAFLANMSHEIRTPFNAILGFTQLLLDSQLPTEAREYLEIVEESAEQLLSLVNGILDYSQIEAGRVRLQAEDVDLRGEAKAVGRLFQVQVSRRGIALDVAVAPDAPPVLRCDPLRLRQILVNLVGNAIKFTSAGRVELQVDTAPEGGVRFTVADTGPGIPPDRLVAIFEPFQQADDSTTREHGGTGLGLGIARQLAELMGGRISVQSELGAGSRFTVVLPDTPVRNGEAIPADLAPPPDPRRYSLAGLSILVAEDNPVNQRLVARLLTKWGCEFDVVENGRDAVTAVQAGTYDLVLMDIHMPGLDGLDAARAIRNLVGPLQLPILAVTASVMADERQRYREAGIDGVVGKPIVAREMHQKMAAALNRTPIRLEF
ncbi:PAS domain S-box protein [bacterium]|nr:PAS domain S-box protein [bacterium]